MNRDGFRMVYTSPKMTADDTAEIMLYGEIINNMPDDWKWDEEDKSSADFRKAINKAKDEGARKLNLRINSPGGIVTESVAMRSILSSAGFDEINIRIEGLCASAATVVASLPGARVEITEGSEYMIHNPWGIVMGNAEEMDKYVTHLRSMESTMRGIYAKRCGADEETIKDWMDKETWFTAKEAVEYGFCDAIAEDGISDGIAACAKDMRNVMMSVYKNVPHHKEEDISDSAEVAAAASVDDITFNEIEEEKNMEIKDITMEQLMAENHELYASILNAGAENERQRMMDIDDLTEAGYEDMAKEAKMSGISAMEFHKQVIKARKTKAEAFMVSRKAETEPAKEVTAGAAEDDKHEMSVDEMAKMLAKDAVSEVHGMY